MTLSHVKSTVSVSFDASVESQPVDGRVLVLIAPDDGQEVEPRFRVEAGINAIQVFGQDVDQLAPGASAVIDETTFGYPQTSLRDLPSGEYVIQAVLHKYETIHLPSGPTVKLPMDRGEGQQWKKAPGNLYSTPTKIWWNAAGGNAVNLQLDQMMPPIPVPEDTTYVRHVRIKSERLSAFWGRDMHLGAFVLLPHDFDAHPEARYPLMIFHGHFPASFNGFRPEPPDPDLEPNYNARFDVHGYNQIEQQEAHALYQTWTGPNFPRFLVMVVQHPTPYYDDSYAVNSATMGPYGDAITYELIPHVEERFRGLGQGWSRFLYGGSTGGWSALAVQVFYPDEYNGCFASCPDPIDFRAFCTVNLYDDDNAYYRSGPFHRHLRPAHRSVRGHLEATFQDFNHLERVLGTKSRSGEQFDAWEAVYSPRGEDGYPMRIYDKLTGAIDRTVAEYWREHYDLRHILERDWPTLGPKLQGKIHIYCGDMDHFYLNNAVVLMENFLKRTQDPPYDGEVSYGDGDGHCWNGDPNQPNHISRLHYHTQYVPKILARIEKTAPPGADVTSWRY